MNTQAHARGVDSYENIYEMKQFASEALGATGSDAIHRVDTDWEPQQQQDNSFIAIADVAATTTTLNYKDPNTSAVSSKVSKQTMNYDGFNNRTDLAEYDYGASSFKRWTHTDYVTDSAYTGLAAVHLLRSLPKKVSVYDSGSVEDASTVPERARTTYGYDPNGNPTTESGSLVPSGQTVGDSSPVVTTTRGYDGYGHVTSVIEPPRSKNVPGVGTDINYVGYNGACVTSVVKAGRTVSAQCDLIPDSDHPGAWAGTANTTNITDANGVHATYTYDESGGLDRLTTVTLAASVPSAATSVQYSYDDFNRVVTTKRDRDNPGDGLLRADTVFDTLSRAIETRRYVNASDSESTRKIYDGQGRVWQVSNPGDTSCYSTSTYDTLDRVLGVTSCDGAAVTSTYVLDQTTVQDQAGVTRTSQTDALGRLTMVTENPAGAVTYAASYTYDPLDDLTNVSHGPLVGGTIQTPQARQFWYDSLRRLTQAHNPESGSVTYAYDDDGNLVQKQDPAVNTCYGTLTGSTCDSSNGYDAFNRVLTKTYSDGTPAVSYTYDADLAISGHTEANYPVGRLVSVTTTDNSTNTIKVSTATVYRYDPLSRVTASAQTTGAADPYIFGYGYNRAGALAGLTYPSNAVVSYGFDGAGRVNSVTKDGRAVASTVSYTPHDAIASMQLGNLWEETLYNKRLQPTDMRLETSLGALDRWRLQNEYGGTTNNGNVIKQTLNVPGLSSPIAEAYQYDPFNRLILGVENPASLPAPMAATATPCATVSGIHCLQYGQYGAWGNRLITDRSGDVGVFANEPPGFDSATNRIQGTGFGYDTRGNLNAQSDNTGMAYDGEGRQMAYCQNAQPCTRQGAVEQYFYDGEGRRVERVGTDGTTVYVYDAGGQLAAEYATAPPAASGMRYLTADHLGTTRAIADESGKLVECHDYYPFGEEVMFGASDPRAGLACYGTVAYGQPGFTGKERDKETDLDYFGARYLSGAQGRFTSADPLLNSGRPWDPQAWNRYAYGLNNPLKFVDPSGLYELDNTCGDGDKKCNKNFARYAKQLRSSLAKLSKKLEKASLAPDERGRLTSALATLGQEGVHNGVYVEFNSLSGTAAAQTNAFEDQQGGISHEITFDPAGEKGNSGDMWAVNAAHEGTHVEDERDPRYNAGGLSDFSTEYRGYMTSSAAAHALGFPSLFVNTGDGSKAEIWNVSWLSADRHTLTSTGQSARDNSITRHVEDKTHPVTVPHDPWGPR